MAITRDTLRLVDELRLTVTQLTDGTTRRLIVAWARAWGEIVTELAAAIDDLIAIGGDRWPTRAQIMRARRAGRALQVAADALETLAAAAQVEISRTAATGAQAAAAAQGAIIASQLPPSVGGISIAAAFDRLDDQALAAIVARTTEQITALTRPLSREATEAMRRELIRGVAMGDNPRETARRMLRRVEGAFNGGLTRALVVARTEVIDAHRAAATASQRANTDVLAGWVWNARLDTRTCPSCWAMHGQTFPLAVPGPLDHQQGRCSRTPKTRTWRDLGFNVDEPPDLMPDAESTFRSLPRVDQLAIMGQARLDLLNQGEISFADLSRRRRTRGWRDSFAPRPVRDLRRRGGLGRFGEDAAGRHEQRRRAPFALVLGVLPGEGQRDADQSPQVFGAVPVIVGTHR